MAAVRSVRRKILYLALGLFVVLTGVFLAVEGSNLRAIFGASTSALAGTAMPPPRAAEAEGRMGNQSPRLDEAAKREAALEEVKKHGVLKSFAAGGGGPAPDDVLGGGNALGSSDIDSVLSNAQGVGVGSVSGTHESVAGGTVTVEPPAGIPGLDAASVTRSVKARTSALRGCYEKALRLRAGLHGRLGVRFTVEANGHVGDCAIESDTLHDDAVSECVTRLMRTWMFPVKPEEAVAASFGFTFAPAEASSGDARRVRMGAVGDAPE